MRTVLGLAGLSGVGKSTVAGEITRIAGDRSVILPFATPVKSLARSYFGWSGEKDERGRRLLQSLGTEIARAWDPDFWVNKWVQALASEYSQYAVVVVDDVRFQNEVAVVLGMGGYVVRLNHPRGAKSSHVSEQPHRLVGCVDLDMGDKAPSDLALCILESIEGDYSVKIHS